MAAVYAQNPLKAKLPTLTMPTMPKMPRMTLNLKRKGGGVPKANDADDPRPDVEAPIPYAEWPLRPYHRNYRFNWFGFLAFVLNLLALGFYLWVRITKTLDLGSYVW